MENVFEAYKVLFSMDCYSSDDMIEMHKILMNNLVKTSGSYRDKNVAVNGGDKVKHMAPQHKLVPQLIEELFTWIKESDAHILIKSCVFHYEFEYIHPFTDRNGRMGRMWQSLMLYQFNPVFSWLPIDAMIRDRQEEYYKILSICDSEGESTKFIEFMLEVILDTLNAISSTDQVCVQVTEQVEKLVDVMDDDSYTTKELMQKLELKHRPTFMSNYLRPALELGYVEMTIPDKPNSSKQKYKKFV